MKIARSKGQIVGLLLVLLAIICTSIAPILIKVGLYVELNPVTLLSFRMIIGAAVLWIVFLLFGPHMLHIDRRGLMYCAVVAMANCLCSMCFIYSLTRIDVSIAMVILSLYPAVVLILLSLRGENTNKLDLIRIVLVIFGVYLIVGPGGKVDSIGIFLIIGTAILYALFLVLIQWFLSDYNSTTIALYVVTFMALIMGVVLLFQPTIWNFPSANGWAVLLCLGIVSTALARVAIFAGIHRIGSRQTALIGPLETLLTVVFAMLLLNERMSFVQIIGGLAIIVSALPAIRQDNRSVNSLPRKPKYL